MLFIIPLRNIKYMKKGSWYENSDWQIHPIDKYPAKLNSQDDVENDVHCMAE